MKSIRSLLTDGTLNITSYLPRHLIFLVGLLLVLFGCSQNTTPGGAGLTPEDEIVLERRIVSVTDDAEERNNRRVNLTSLNLDLGVDRRTPQTVGLRFTNVTIPAGATINRAYVTFTVGSTSAAATSLVFHAEASDNAATFTNSKGNLSGRSLTEASVTWQPDAWTQVGEAGPKQQSPELANLLQEVVNRPGWVSGRAMVLVITGTGTRIARSFDGAAGSAPLLHLEYTTSTPVNRAPTVNAGPDQSVPLSTPATLTGTASDDGLPNGTLSMTWSKVSGPGTVTFADAKALSTTATFSTTGSYELGLSVSDGALTTADHLIVTVTSAPQVTVSISPSSASLGPTETASFSATVSGSNNTGVTWSTSGGTISGSGNTITYTAPAINGSYTLTATSLADPNRKATATIIVSRSTGSVTIAAAGDIACDPSSGSFNGGNGSASSCHMKATSDLLLNIKPNAVLTLGDNQYENGALDKYLASYDPSWGRSKTITYPTAGNHEYATANASGYYQYFGAAAGDPRKGYYSYDLGGWHFIALNSNCGAVGGCSSGSPQETWLRTDLAAHPAACTLAYWHHPRFSSGEHGSNTFMTAIWQALYDGGADLVLSGHDHNYERFAPQTASGSLDAANGIRQFVVGTGGKSHYAVNTPIANSEVRNDDTYGVLKLTLKATSYDWEFVPEAGKTFGDAGTASCH